MKISKSIPRTLFFLISMTSLPTFAADLYVIGNTAGTFSGSEIGDIYAAEKQTGNGAVLFDNSSAQRDFLDKVVKLDSAKYKDNWTKKSFRDGVPIPTVKTNDADVVAAVKANPKALGYVSSAPSGVKIITSYSSPSIDLNSCEKPKYPKSSLMNEETGTVEIEFVVSGDGKALDSKVTKSSGSKTLDKATIAAYSVCKFNAGKKDGKAEDGKLLISYSWKLE